MRSSSSPSSSPPWASATRASTARRRRPRPCGRACRRAPACCATASRRTVPLEEVVPGDVVLLSAGSLVPADGVVLEATDCFVSEAVLTGESFPVEKQPGASQPAAPLAERTNCVFLGTNVRSGTARCLVVATGPATEFGAIAHRLTLRPPETEFDRGIRRFGYLLTSAMLIMVLARLRRARVPRPAAGRDAAVLGRARRGAEPGAAAGHPQRQPGARRPDDGAPRRAGAAPQRDREPREHGRPLHRQDRHAHRRRRASWKARTTRRARQPTRCSSSAP